MKRILAVLVLLAAQAAYAECHKIVAGGDSKASQACDDTATPDIYILGVDYTEKQTVAFTYAFIDEPKCTGLTFSTGVDKRQYERSAYILMIDLELPKFYIAENHPGSHFTRVDADSYAEAASEVCLTVKSGQL